MKKRALFYLVLFVNLVVTLFMAGKVYAAIDVTTSVKDTSGAVIAGAAIARSPAGSGSNPYSWGNNTNVTFTAPNLSASGYQFVRFDRVRSTGTSDSTTSNPKTYTDFANNSVYTLTAVYKRVVSVAASYSSIPAGAPNGTFTSSTGALTGIDINTSPTFTVNAPANWIIDTVRVDAVGGTAMDLSCNVTKSSCSFTYNVGTTNHTFYVAMVPYDNPTIIVSPIPIARTTTSLTITMPPAIISDADGVQNTTYYLYDTDGTTLLTSNTTGQFTGLTEAKIYWIRVTAQTKNATTGQWVQQATSLQQTSTSAPTYTITSSVASGSGAVTINGVEVSSWPNVTNIEGNQSATFVIVPTTNASEEYALTDIKLNGVSQGPQNPFTIPNINANKTVEIYFKRVWTIAVSAGAGGSISPANPAKVVDGASQAFTIIPATNADVLQVLVDGAPQGAITSYTFTNVTANHSIAASFVVSDSDMGKYSVIPPFIASAIKPNLLLMLDNSASMYDLAYSTTSTYCYDESYSDASSYEGYFAQAEIYSYNAVANKFESGASLPATCTFKTSYMCVNMTGTSPNRTVTQFVASGKFLNWLTASKLDIQKKVLTGGKFNTTYNVLEAESRGCVGRRFVKALPAVAGLSFTVRGPNAYDPDFVSQSTQGGGTRIEIYDAAYNKTECLAAAAAWVDPNSIGDVQKITRDCIGSGTNALKTDAYNHIIHQCFWALTGDHKLANMVALQGDCIKIYDTYYSNDPSRITNETAADAVCASTLIHPDWGRGNTIGFLGRCVSTNPDGTKFFEKDDATVACSDTEIRDYCSGVSEFDVTDPSNASTVVTTDPVAVPSFIMDAGVNALGNIAGSFLVRIALTAQPTGIIQDYKDYIQFGAMAFNRDGSGTECNDGINNTTSPIKCAKNCSITTTKQCYVNSDCPAGESCVLSTKTDGAKILTYAGFDPVGDHTSGMIKAIDDIQAASWTPWAEAYYNAIGYFGNRTDLRLQATDFDATKSPSDVTCRLNNILLISDGGSTADQHSAVNTLAGIYNDGDGQTGTCAGFKGSKNLDDLAWLAKNRNIKTFNKTTASSDAPTNNSEFVTTYSVFTGVSDGTVGECNPQTLMSQTAVRGGTTPYVADGGSAFRNALDDAFRKIAASSASGTAASILSNSEGSGAALMQAVFYPKKEFDKNASNQDTSAQWLGELQSFWYFLDPYLNKSSIREDSDQDFYLKLNADKILQFQFDTVKKKTQVYRFLDTNADGISDGPDAVDGSGNQVAYDPDVIKSLWRAGRSLWLRDPAANPVRKIYTTLNGSSLVDFDATLKSNATARTYLRMGTEDDAEKLISYIRGVDQADFRSRTVAIKSCSNNRLKSCSADTDCPSSTCTPHSAVWKLGDIISSTPKLVSPGRLNNYNMAPPNGYNDNSYKDFFQSASYQSRGMAFVGANDGMLHAFRMGILKEISDRTTKAKLTYPDTATTASAASNLGQEEWAFIPRHALPYLKYLSDKNYTHLYYVDRSPTILDASIGIPDECTDDYGNCPKTAATWRTVLIGGMGIGGASRTKTPSTDCTDCIKAPIDDIGYSSYFALDITNPASPSLLWEFSGDPSGMGTLGLSTTGPAIVKVAARQKAANGDATEKPDHSKNGRWFAVFASGATGKINTTEHSLSGISDQNLHVFVVDLASGALVKKIDTGIANAFAGTLSTAVFDADRNSSSSNGFYSDDTVYIGYVKKDTSTNTWTKGGVLRLTVPELSDPTSATFANQWQVSEVIADTGPITTSITKLQDRRNKNFWLFFGTGRYFTRTDDTSTTRQTLYGVKEPCYSATGGPDNDILLSCTASVDTGKIVDQSADSGTPAASLAADATGWKINLDAKGKYCSMDQALTCTTDANCVVGSVNKGVCTEYLTERVITDPIAMANGAVFFTSFKPSADICAYGGSSLIWALKYDTGDVPPAKAMQGQALMQVSTGAFAEIKMSDAFKNPDSTRYGGRRLAVPITGVPPTAQGLSLFTNPPPAKKFIHVREK